MTQSETRILEGSQPRDVCAVQCPCGGFAAETEVRPDEIQYQSCGRPYACCLGAFVCNLCGQRILAHLDAPEYR